MSVNEEGFISVDVESKTDPFSLYYKSSVELKVLTEFGEIVVSSVSPAHAYHALKYIDDFELFEKINTSTDPYKESRKHEPPDEFYKQRYHITYNIVKSKFVRDAKLMEMLKMTGNAKFSVKSKDGWFEREYGGILRKIRTRLCVEHSMRVAPIVFLW